MLEDGDDLEARAAVLEGAMLAGMAFVNASVAAIHGLAYPLGARFHVPHGHANALVMGPVLRFNLRAATPLYAELAPCVLPGRAFASGAEAAAAFVAAMEAMAGWGGLATRMSHFGVTAADIPSMADEVVTQIQRLIATNHVRHGVRGCLRDLSRGPVVLAVLTAGSNPARGERCESDRCAESLRRNPPGRGGWMVPRATFPTRSIRAQPRSARPAASSRCRRTAARPS
ncbi:iron-containing alcohol dehydrogenase [Thauera aromatica]|uniref:iron-containing alcohol dehydrogenase n=1 Tax=Thauera aromatica TaxID=59405 RepID=UPI001FFC426C|nr:iron-containing alcohol dehydrogenase [Thauera aromatica]